MNRSVRGAALVATLLLTGCDSLRDSPWGQYFQILQQGMHGALGDSGVTRAQAAAIPYASLGYRIGNGPEMILVLATDIGGQQLWTSAAHVVLVTNGGRAVRTQKLPHDLGATTPVAGHDLPSPAAALAGPVAYRRSVDFPDMGVFGALVTCRASEPHPEAIQILGSTIQTQRILESCSAPSLNWTFTDTFWIDSQSGLVWRSTQHVHPKLDELHIEIFRPPG